MKAKKKAVIDKNIVAHVADLAKLSLKEEELEKFKNQLSTIFKYVDQIGEMKTDRVPVTTNVLGLKNCFRKDAIDKEKMLTQEEALSQAKKVHKGFFVVKAIFER